MVQGAGGKTGRALRAMDAYQATAGRKGVDLFDIPDAAAELRDHRRRDRVSRAASRDSGLPLEVAVIHRERPGDLGSVEPGRGWRSGGEAEREQPALQVGVV